MSLSLEEKDMPKMTHQDTATLRPLPAFLGTVALALLDACAVTSHPTETPGHGQATSLAVVESTLATPGPVRVETLTSADWQVDRSGLINLDHERARHLHEGPEAIQIYFHVLDHPQRGLFMVDTGVARAILNPDDSPLSWPVTAAMNMEALEVHTTTADWLQAQEQPLRAVFVTHLHLDHIMGLPDIPHDVPLYTGPHEAGDRAFMHMFVQGTNDRLLAGRAPLRTWKFSREQQPGDLAAVDVLGDASVFALHVPGHTPGSTAFVVRTPDGPALLVGDACHTRFGWDNDVEPGTFSRDQQQSAASLKALRNLAKRHPTMRVRLGHQE